MRTHRPLSSEDPAPGGSQMGDEVMRYRAGVWVKLTVLHSIFGGATHREAADGQDICPRVILFEEACLGNDPELSTHFKIEDVCATLRQTDVC